MSEAGLSAEGRRGEDPDKFTTAECAHCGGEGCRYCDLKGSVTIRAPPQRCRHCEGDGCIYCGFTGWAGLLGKYD